MRFSKRFERYKVPAWAPFYVSYKMLKDFLSPFKYMKKDLHLCNPYGQGTLDIHHFTRKDKEKLLYFVKLFEEMVVTDMDKIVMFYALKVNKAIEKWRKVRINLLIYKRNEAYFPKRIREEHWSELKYSFEGLIKRAKLINEYVALNLEAFEKVLKKQIKFVSPFFPEICLRYRFEKYMIETKIFKMRDLVMNFLSSLENEYLDYFHDYESKGVREVRKIYSGTLLSKNGAFMFGVFAGCTVLLLLVLILMAWSGSTDLGNQDFLAVAFPIYRMLAIIFIYIWLLGFNIFGWTAYHVNYKYLFSFKHHHSELWKVLRVGAIFTTILLISLIWYFLIEDQIGRLGTALDFIPKEVPALIVIGLFLAYLLFPHRRWLNGRGRRHILYLVRQILKTPFIPVTFTLIWVTDQLTAFAQPLKDLEYTICFYIGYLTASSWGSEECKSNKRVSRSLIMALIPNVLRMLQCLRQVYDAREKRHKPLINFGKYFVGCLVTVLSYLVVLYDTEMIFIILWFVFIGIGAVYNYLWDIKCDWGLLRRNSRYKLLRDVLSYKNPWIYYFIMAIDLFLRAVTLMSLSSPVISAVMEPALYQFLIALITICHRCIWNFFRVENEHLQNLKGYHVVLHLRLPYKKRKFDDKADEEQWNQDLKAILFYQSELKLKGKKHNHFANQSCMIDMMRHSKPRDMEDEESSYSDDGDGEKEKMTKHPKSGENALYALKKICDRPFRTINNLNRKKVEKLTRKIDNYKKIDLNVAVYYHIWKAQIEEVKKYLFIKVQAIKMASFYSATGSLQIPNINQVPENIESRHGAQVQDNLNTNAETNQGLNKDDIPNTATPFTIKERVQSDKGNGKDDNHVELDISEGNKERNQLPRIAEPSTDQIEPGTQIQDEGYGVKGSSNHHEHVSDDNDDD